jgi:PAS domain S-box-containing protein
MGTQGKGGKPTRVARSLTMRARLEQAESRLQEIEERYALATAVSREGIYEWDLDGGRFLLTERAKEFFALTDDNLTPAAWNARIHRDDYPGYRAAIIDHFKRRTPHLEQEYRIVDAEGRYRWIRDRGIGVRNANDKVTKVVGALSDITQRKLTEIELRRARDLAEEALEHQTAMSEILRVMSRSPTDAQPVFDLVAQRAGKLCNAGVAVVSSFDGKLIDLAAIDGLVPDAVRIARGLFPMQIGADAVSARAIRSATVVHIGDVLADPSYALKDFARAARYRGALGVPIVRDRQVIGSIFVGRATPGLFADPQIDLLKAFADQAAIAIENVRLFNETKKALDQQTATSEILRVISGSLTDAQPAFDTIAAAALALCHASSASVVTFDGELIHARSVAALNRKSADALRKLFPRPPGRSLTASRAILTRDVVVIPDVLEDPDYENKTAAVAGGFRSTLAVPLLRDGRSIGAITLGRPEPGSFPQEQISLLRTFADQAVIAIENARLFTELEARNRDLSEALEHQTATGEILRVISSSLADVQPVFEIIGERARKLCNAEIGVVSRVEGDQIHLAAIHGVSEEGKETIRRLHPMRLSVETATARAIRGCAVVHISDVMADPTYEIKDAATAGGWRAGLAVPMLREGQVIGAIFVGRTNPGLFAGSKIALLKTFADQAVIAIENVRLFNETKEALERQTAISEILRAISSSPSEVQPMLDAVAERALKLCDAAHSVILLVEGDEVRIAAGFGTSGDAVGEVVPLTRGLVAGRAILDRNTVHLEDLATVSEEEYPVARDMQRCIGHHTTLAVPLMREDRAIGAIALWRMEARRFTERHIALVKTFADQAVIAIENVRLFNETKEALEQQTATGEILRVISSSPTQLQPVLEAVVSAAARFCGAPDVLIQRVDGDVLRIAAGVGQFAEVIRLRAGSIAAVEIPINRASVSGRAVFERRTIHIDDLAAENEDEYPLGRELQHRFGHHTCLATPLLREGMPLGAIFLSRMEVSPFSEKQIELLRTFADQAVIAIENVRLFTELEVRTVELTRSVGELKALGEVGQAVSSTLDLDAVLRTIVSRATQLAGVDGGSIYEYDPDREEFHVRATERLPNDLVDTMRATPIRKGEGLLGRMAISGEPVEIPDIGDARAYQSRARAKLIRLGYRSLLAVPLLRENQILGGLAVYRKHAGAFDPQVIELLKTFATQSALAIQNARLFREIEVKGRQLETASRHKSEFLANMSHELRTPLNAIIGFSEVLSERMFGDINEKQAEYIGDILESGQHLLSLINDILDLSKIEAGRMELESTEFDLPSTIGNTLSLVKERAHRRGITLERALDERLGMIRADERKVKQVLLNLLSNALKFTPEGGRIDVRAAMHDGIAEISVTDTGVGIAPEDQEAVFEEFRQVGKASKKVEGTGLGLAISRKFIELHGGRIWVTSQVGTGSTFTFTLPLQ